MCLLQRVLKVLGCLCIFPLSVIAAEADFIGEWKLTITQGRVVQTGTLAITQTADGVKGMVENGPIRMEISGNSIIMGIDDWGRAGGRLERHLTGILSGDQMSGKFGPEFPLTDEEALLCKVSAPNCPHPEGTWSATRKPVMAQKQDLTPQPVDITGSWRGSETGLRRWTRDVTPVGQAWLDEFNVEFDLPRLRCLSAGLWSVWEYYGSFELLQGSDPHVLTMLIGPEIRRIYMDDRRPDEFEDHRPMGFSWGKWEGKTLVVTTTHLLGSVMGFNGNPISNDAQIIERYTVNEDGTISSTISLIDPINYNSPPIYSREFSPAQPSNRISFPVVCDPDSFYRGLFFKGQFDEYNNRAHMRF